MEAGAAYATADSSQNQINLWFTIPPGTAIIQVPDRPVPVLISEATGQMIQELPIPSHCLPSVTGGTLNIHVLHSPASAPMHAPTAPMLSPPGMYGGMHASMSSSLLPPHIAGSYGRPVQPWYVPMHQQETLPQPVSIDRAAPWDRNRGGFGGEYYARGPDPQDRGWGRRTTSSQPSSAPQSPIPDQEPVASRPDSPVRSDDFVTDAKPSVVGKPADSPPKLQHSGPIHQPPSSETRVKAIIGKAVAPQVLDGTHPSILRPPEADAQSVRNENSLLAKASDDVARADTISLLSSGEGTLTAHLPRSQKAHSDYSGRRSSTNCSVHGIIVTDCTPADGLTAETSLTCFGHITARMYFRRCKQHDQWRLEDSVVDRELVKGEKPKQRVKKNIAASSDAGPWARVSAELQLVAEASFEPEMRECIIKGTVPRISPGDILELVVLVLDRRGAPADAPLEAIPADILRYTVPCSRPSAPTSLTAAKSTKVSIKLKWNPPTSDGGDKLDAYELQSSLVYTDAPVAVEGAEIVTSHSGIVYAWLTCYEGTDKSFEAKSLYSGTSYAFRVRARNLAGWGAFSSVMIHRTESGAPMPPKDLHASDVTAHGCRVTWSAPSHDGGAPVLEYFVEQAVGATVADSSQKPGAELRFVQVYRGSQTEMTLSDLPSNTSYTLRAWAANSVGPSSLADLHSYRTKCDLPAKTGWIRLRRQAAATGKHNEAVATSDSVIEWEGMQSASTIPTRLGDGICSFRVQICKCQPHFLSGASQQVRQGDAAFYISDEAREFVLPSSAQGCPIEGLEPGSTYAARVASVNDAGQGGYSDWMVFSSQATAPGPAVIVDMCAESGAVLEDRWLDAAMLKITVALSSSGGAAISDVVCWARHTSPPVDSGSYMDLEDVLLEADQCYSCVLPQQCKMAGMHPSTDARPALILCNVAPASEQLLASMVLPASEFDALDVGRSPGSHQESVSCTKPSYATKTSNFANIHRYPLLQLLTTTEWVKIPCTVDLADDSTALIKTSNCLLPGHAYEIKVCAVNSQGSGPTTAAHTMSIEGSTMAKRPAVASCRPCVAPSVHAAFAGLAQPVEVVPGGHADLSTGETYSTILLGMPDGDMEQAEVQVFDAQSLRASNHTLTQPLEAWLQAPVRQQVTSQRADMQLKSTHSGDFSTTIVVPRKLSVEQRQGVVWPADLSESMYSHEICGLAPGSAYLVRARAKVAGRWSGLSDWALVVTAARIPTCPAHVGFTLLSAKDAANYLHKVLSPAAQLRTTVQQCVDMLGSSYHADSRISQAACVAWAPPQDTFGLPVDEYEAEITATPFGGMKPVITDTSLQQILPAEMSDSQSVSVRLTSSVFMVGALPPASHLRLRIRAHTAAGWGLASKGVEFISAPDVPPVPQRLIPTSISSSSARLLCCIPETCSEAAPVLGFELQRLGLKPELCPELAIVSNVHSEAFQSLANVWVLDNEAVVRSKITTTQESASAGIAPHIYSQLQASWMVASERAPPLLDVSRYKGTTSWGFKLQKLHPNTIYFFRYAAVNVSGVSPYSAWTIIRTEPAVAAPVTAVDSVEFKNAKLTKRTRIEPASPAPVLEAPVQEAREDVIATASTLISNEPVKADRDDESELSRPADLRAHLLGLKLARMTLAERMRYRWNKLPYNLRFVILSVSAALIAILLFWLAQPEDSRNLRE